jgi:hypothetical protein
MGHKGTALQLTTAKTHKLKNVALKYALFKGTGSPYIYIVRPRPK